MAEPCSSATTPRCPPWRSAPAARSPRSAWSLARPPTGFSDGDAVLLDGGTTTLEVARLLVGRSLQIVTNSLPIANLFASSRETDLVMLGGYVYPRTGVALGPLHGPHDGRHSRSPDDPERRRHHRTGLFNSNLLLVETERQMMHCADEVVVVADHTKIGRQPWRSCASGRSRHADRRCRA